MERSCDTCKWAKHWAEMDREEQRVLILQLYAQGIPIAEWNNYVLCEHIGWVIRRKDNVCEEWEEREDVPDVADAGD